MRKFLSVAFLSVFLVGLFSGCANRSGPAGSEAPEQSEPVSEPSVQSREPAYNYFPDGGGLLQFQPVQPGDTIAVMKTSMGEVRIRLFPLHAPLAVNNFVSLGEAGFYNGRNFHRVIDGFMIQGGAVNATGAGGASVYTDESGNPMPFEDEFTTDLWNFRGALCMANSGPNTNSSQFFIVQNSALSKEALETMKAIQYPENVMEAYEKHGGAFHLDMRHTVFGQVIEGMDVVDLIAAVETGDNDRPIKDVLIESLTFETAE